MYGVMILNSKSVLVKIWKHEVWFDINPQPKYWKVQKKNFIFISALHTLMVKTCLAAPPKNMNECLLG